MSLPLLPGELAGPVGGWIGTYLVHSTALFLLAWGVARLVRSASVREQLWRAALFGPLVTASVQVGAGVDPLLGRLDLGGDRAATEQVADARELTVVPDLRPAARPRLMIAERPAAVPVPPPATAPAPAATRRADWGRAASLLLALGIVALTFRVLVEAIRVHRLGGRKRLREGELVDTVDAMRRDAGILRPVRVETTEMGLSPYATGVLMPRIVVPRRAFAELSRSAQRAMIAHELGHIARLDPLWSAAARSVSSLLFFQPLNWITCAHLEETAEFACDEFAVRQTGDEIALARCLTTVAEWIVGPTDPEPACTMARKGSKLGERVERILAVESRPRRRETIGGRALGALAVAFAAGLAPGVAIAAAPSNAPEALDRPIEVSLEPEAGSMDLAELFAGLDRMAALVSSEVDQLRALSATRAVDGETLERLDEMERRVMRVRSLVRLLRNQAAGR